MQSENQNNQNEDQKKDTSKKVDQKNKENEQSLPPQPPSPPGMGAALTKAITSNLTAAGVGIAALIVGPFGWAGIFIVLAVFLFNYLMAKAFDDWYKKYLDQYADLLTNDLAKRAGITNPDEIRNLKEAFKKILTENTKEMKENLKKEYMQKTDKITKEHKAKVDEIKNDQSLDQKTKDKKLKELDGKFNTDIEALHKEFELKIQQEMQNNEPLQKAIQEKYDEVLKKRRGEIESDQSLSKEEKKQQLSQLDKGLSKEEMENLTKRGQEGILSEIQKSQNEIKSKLKEDEKQNLNNLENNSSHDELGKFSKEHQVQKRLQSELDDLSGQLEDEQKINEDLKRQFQQKQQFQNQQQGQSYQNNNNNFKINHDQNQQGKIYLQNQHYRNPYSTQQQQYQNQQFNPQFQNQQNQQSNQPQYQQNQYQQSNQQYQNLSLQNMQQQDQLNYMNYGQQQNYQQNLLDGDKQKFANNNNNFVK